MTNNKKKENVFYCPKCGSELIVSGMLQTVKAQDFKWVGGNSYYETTSELYESQCSDSYFVDEIRCPDCGFEVYNPEDAGSCTPNSVDELFEFIQNIIDEDNE
jgi:transcription elongation factor Elf1